MTKNLFLEELSKTFTNNADANIAQEQALYLKNLFKHLGLPTPLRRKIMQPLIKNLEIKNEIELVEIINKLWSKKEREYHYCAIEILNKYHKLWSEKTLDLITKLIIENSWWDTVDTLATNSIGLFMLKYPQHIPKTKDWISTDNMWLRRTAILFQLKYKNKTNYDMLFDYCHKTMYEKEFFIRKAIGWALREFSKTDKQKVKNFIDVNRLNLSGLSIREASKYI